MLEAARFAASYSKDPSTQVGAAATVGGETHLTHNHLCPGCPDEWYHDRALKYPNVVHAEEKLVAVLGPQLLGATIAVTAFPCGPCAKLLVAAGVARVIAALEPSYEARWADSVKESQDRLNRAGVEYRVYERKQYAADSGELTETTGRDVGGEQRSSGYARR